MRTAVYFIEIKWIAPGNYPEEGFYSPKNEKYFDTYEEAERAILSDEIKDPPHWRVCEYSIKRVWINK